MNENPGIFLTIIAFLLLLGPLVFVHEMGHYLVGRWFGVKADSFSIGFGKELFGWTDRRGTRWKLAALPLGGYVQFAGDMNPASQPDSEWKALPEAERNQTFQSKTLWQRSLIVAAGPIVNFVFAALIFAGFAMAYGQSVTPPVVFDVTGKDAPAAVAGLEKGDRIISADGKTITYFDDLREHIIFRPGENVDLVVERDGQQRDISMTIGTELQVDRFGNEYRYGLIGIQSVGQEYIPVSWWQAPVIGIERTFATVDQIITTLGQIITGRRSVRELGGPLKIAQVSGEFFAAGVDQFVFLVALISINLGFINLLPIPMLDGGHLAFYAAEAIRRRPATARTQEMAFRFGLTFVLAFMVLVTVNDVLSFGLLGR